MTCTTCIVITCYGSAVAIIEERLLTTRTRSYPPGTVGHIHDELRTAAAQDRVRR